MTPEATSRSVAFWHWWWLAVRRSSLAGDLTGKDLRAYLGVHVPSIGPAAVPLFSFLKDTQHDFANFQGPTLMSRKWKLKLCV